MADQLLTVEQTADRLHLQPSTVRRQLRNGALRGIKRGHVWRVPESALYSSSEVRNNDSPLSVADAIWHDIASGDARKRGAAIKRLAFASPEVSEIVGARSGEAAAKFYASPEGISEWEEMADWRALDGQPFHGFEEEDAEEEQS